MRTPRTPWEKTFAACTKAKGLFLDARAKLETIKQQMSTQKDWAWAGKADYTNAVNKMTIDMHVALSDFGRDFIVLDGRDVKKHNANNPMFESHLSALSCELQAMSDKAGRMVRKTLEAHKLELQYG